MNIITVSGATATSRAARLSAATDDLHEHLHGVVAAADPFGSRARFGRWAQVQYQFHGELEPLHRRASLQALIPDLATRARSAVVAQDLADLGVSLPAPAPLALDALDDGQALGWLFVAEGSTLGAAMLLKRAEALGLSETFGARHLAAAPEGRARHWKAFTAVLDGLALGQDEEARMVTAARRAFERFAVLLTSAFALPHQ